MLGFYYAAKTQKLGEARKRPKPGSLWVLDEDRCFGQDALLDELDAGVGRLIAVIHLKGKGQFAGAFQTSVRCLAARPDLLLVFDGETWKAQDTSMSTDRTWKAFLGEASPFATPCLCKRPALGT